MVWGECFISIHLTASLPLDEVQILNEPMYVLILLYFLWQLQLQLHISDIILALYLGTLCPWEAAAGTIVVG